MSETQINVGMNVDGVITGTEKAKRKISELGGAAREAGKGTGAIGDGIAGSAQKVEAATKNMIGSIQRQTAAMEAGERGGRKYYETLAAQRGLDVAVFKPYLDQLDAVKIKQEAANAALLASRPAMDSMGMSAKAMAANLRGVPAQFTDIVTSLQGGQAPLTVLLQQGGQLKDMFGGVGNAAKALGGYVVGLINPFTLAAGAAVVLGVAYKQGSEEVDAFRKSLVMSGNDMGNSIGNLQAMAASIGGTTGTIGGAAAALSVMAGSSNIAVGSLEKMTESAIRFEKYAGVAIKDTAKAFAELGNDPVQASEKLNKQYNYLTASVYEQIRALEEQGNKTGAVALAQNEFSTAQSRMATEIESGLGRIEQAWNLAGKAAKWSWDQFLGIGRPDSIDATIGKLETQLKALQNSPSITNGNWEKRTQDDLDYWKHIKASQDDYASHQKTIAQQTQAQIELDKAYEGSLGKTAKMQREIAQLSGQFSFADQSQANIEKYAKAVAGIQEKYKDAPKHIKAASDAYMTLYESLLKNNDQSQIELDTGTKITAGSREHLDALKQINAEYRKGKIGIVESEVLKSIADETAANRARSEASKEAIKVDQDSYKIMHDLQKQAEADYKSAAKSANEYLLSAQEYADVVAMESNLVGLNTDQRKLAIEQYKIEAEWKKEIARIDAMSNLDTEQKNAEKDKYSAAKLIKLNTATTKSFQDQWLATADAIRDGLTDAFMQAIDGTKSLWVALRDSVESMFKNMALKPIIQGVMQPIATAVTGSLIGTSANAATGVSASSGLLSAAFPGAAAAMSTVGNAALAGIQSMVGMTGTAAQAATAAANGIAYGTAGAASSAATLGAAVPYVAAALIAYKLLQGPGFTSATDSGRARVDYSASGVAGSAYGTTGSTEQITAMTASTNALAKTYFDTAKSLGIAAIKGAFEVGTNTGQEGANPNTVIGATFGSLGYSSGEISSSDSAALSLAASRAVLTALQASELPGYLSGVFDNITASTASQDQIASALAFAQSLKTVRDGLLETRTPLQILKDSVTDGFSTLGTSADTFKADFVAAIDSGLNAENLAKWQALQTTITSLASASDAADTALNKVLQSLQTKGADLQDQYDKLTMSLSAYRDQSIAGYTEQEKAQARANFALEDSIAAYNAQADAVTASADAAKTAAQAYYDAASTSASSALTAVNKAIEVQRKIYQVQVSAAQSAVTEIKSVFDVLKSNIDSLYGSSSAKASQGAAFIDQALSTAQTTGYLPDSTQLADAITAARGGVDSAVYASQQDADFARLALAGKLDQLKSISGLQLTGADKALSVAQAQLTKLDDIAQSAQDQLDATNGINTALLSVADALKAFGAATSALANARQSQGLSTAASAESLRLGYAQNYIKQVYDGSEASLINIADKAKSSGYTQADLANSMGLPVDDVRKLFESVGIPAFAGGGYHAGGLALVGEGGPEIVNFAQPAQIYTARQTEAMLGGNTARLESLVEGLTAEVQRLQAIVNDGNSHTRRTADTLENVTEGGANMRMVAA